MTLRGRHGPRGGKGRGRGTLSPDRLSAEAPGSKRRPVVRQAVLVYSAMRITRLTLPALVATLLCAAPSVCHGSHSIELLLGTAVNFRTPLAVRQEGQPEIELGARYSTRPLTTPLYYAVRFSSEDEGTAWELQFIHHKLHLSNPPPEIQHFEITHGFNLFTVNRAFDTRWAEFRVGVGLVLAHTESTVRGLGGPGGGILDTGYRLTGPCLVTGVGKELALSTDVYVSGEVQLIGAWARVPVAKGSATAPNVALHFLLGVGYRF
jgi:hypothetical protein